MTHRLTTNYAKNYCNRTLIVKVIIENVVTCFLGHSVCITVQNIGQVETCILADRHVTVLEIANELGLSVGSETLSGIPKFLRQSSTSI